MYTRGTCLVLANKTSADFISNTGLVDIGEDEAAFNCSYSVFGVYSEIR